MSDDFMRREIERAIRDAEHPAGMRVHDGKARVSAALLRRLLAENEALRADRDALRATRESAPGLLTQFAFGLAPVKTEGAPIPLEDRIRVLRLGQQQDEVLLKQALEALEYHQEQTRPIWRTTVAIEALQQRLGEKE